MLHHQPRKIANRDPGGLIVLAAITALATAALLWLTG
jgi:hypothetical protein